MNERSFVVRKIIDPIIRAEGETLDELIRVLRECFKNQKKISAVYLFGSVVKGEEKDDSDVDLLVISDDFEAASAAVSIALEKVAVVFHKKLSPLIFSEEQLRTKKKSDLVYAIASNNILIVGKNFLAR